MSQEYERCLRAGDDAETAMRKAMEKFRKEIAYVQTEPKVLLGCQFENENEYTYNKRNKWGDELPPMKFKTDDEFEIFKSNLSAICSSVLESTTYNDVDQLVR